jgi:HEAT repeat protein
MPFIKRGESAPGRNADASPPVAALGSPDAQARWSAARALGGNAAAVPALAAALAAEDVARVREAIVTALVRVGDEASIRALLPYLRSQDSALRAAAIEALQALPEATLPFMTALLADMDTDVRILATELARNMPAKDATRVLCGVLESDPHPNVCAAAIEVLAEVGTSAAVPALTACAARFSGTPFLPFAASTAIARISGAKG